MLFAALLICVWYSIAIYCRALQQLLTSPTHAGAEERRAEHKAGAVATLHLLADALARAAADGDSGEVRRAAMQCIKEVCVPQ